MLKYCDLESYLAALNGGPRASCARTLVLMVGSWVAREDILVVVSRRNTVSLAHAINHLSEFSKVFRGSDWSITKSSPA